MINIFGLKINLGDFFTQIAHGLTIVAGVGGMLFAPQVNTAISGVQVAVATTASTVSNTSDPIAILGGIVSLIGTIALLVHNAETPVVSTSAATANSK
jgi:hypothetical protein